MDLIVVGCSHKSTPVEVREGLAFPSDRMVEFLKGLVDKPGVEEGVIVSTCNRVEIYAIAGEGAPGVETIREFFAATHDKNPEDVRPYLYSFTGDAAAAHIFKVCASLDSMVVGEPQITGQVKDAYDKALETGVTGTVMNQVMHRAFTVAKRVRNETGIARSAVSISFAAVELAKKIFEDLSDKTVLLIGAGEMIELAARHLVNNGIREVIVANRTYQRAVDLAAEFRGRPVPLEQMPEILHEADIVISSTGAPTTVLGPVEVEEALKRRKRRPMFLIDIAVPRDIEKSVNDLEGAYLYDIDDLQQVVDSNIKERQKEAGKAMVIIEAEVGSFVRWLTALDAVPTITKLREKVEAIRQAEMEKSFKKMKPDQETQQRIDALTRAIVNKILHAPLTRLKQESQGERSNQFVTVTRDLFELNDEETGKGESE
jgi:glutamyl-tRNA reductase